MGFLWRPGPHSRVSDLGVLLWDVLQGSPLELTSSDYMLKKYWLRGCQGVRVCVCVCGRGGVEFKTISHEVHLLQPGSLKIFLGEGKGILPIQRKEILEISPKTCGGRKAVIAI